MRPTSEQLRRLQVLRHDREILGFLSTELEKTTQHLVDATEPDEFYRLQGRARFIRDLIKTITTE